MRAKSKYGTLKGNRDATGESWTLRTRHKGRRKPSTHFARNCTHSFPSHRYMLQFRSLFSTSLSSISRPTERLSRRPALHVSQLWFPGLGTPALGQYSLSARFTTARHHRRLGGASHRRRGDSIKSIPWKMHPRARHRTTLLSRRRAPLERERSSPLVRKGKERRGEERREKIPPLSASFHLPSRLCRLDRRATPSLSMIVGAPSANELSP